jgi:hypothetical protein
MTAPTEPRSPAQRAADAEHVAQHRLTQELAAAAPLDLTPRPVHITHADAQDVSKYRRARALAAESGAQLIIDDAVPVPFVPEPGAVVIPPHASHAEYRRLKADAERRGVPYVVHP